MSMIRSSFYIFLVISAITAAPNSYLDSIPSLGDWIYSLNSKNELVQVETDEVPNEEPHKIVDASKSNKDIRADVNLDEPIPVDDLLDQLNDEIQLSDDQHKSELVGISQQLGRALYDNSIGKVLMKGIGHAVDLGLANSLQRKRSAEKANGMVKSFLNGLRGVGKWLCGLFVSNEPKHIFDLRKAWPACKEVISSIRSQGGIGSCWAVAVASVLSDVFCIASNGKHQLPLSAEDLLRCCKTCVKLDDGGTERADIEETLNFVKNDGIVTGGVYGSRKGCIPYSLVPPSHKYFDLFEKKIGECDKKCTNKYKTPYEKDKHYITGYTRYELPRDAAVIKEYLKTKGSCIAKMLVYKDFRKDYEQGIYAHHEESEFIDNHYLRLIGWGEEDGIEYWLVANSWDKEWGEKGLFRINMNNNGCDFGKPIWCVEPKLV